MSASEDRGSGRLESVAVPLLVAGVLTLATATVGSRFVSGFPLELLTHFQVQYLVGAVGCAAALAVFRRWRWVAPAVACAVLAGWSLRSYHPWDRSAPAAGTPADLRLVLANVLASNRRHERVLEMARSANADVLIFQEVNRRWREALRPITRTHPYTLAGDGDRAGGFAVFSRLPLRKVSIHDLGNPLRPCLSLEVEVDGMPVEVVSTHPAHPISAERYHLRNAQLREVARFTAGRAHPLVLIGDLNTTMWSPSYRRLCAETGLVNARRGFGVLPTWPRPLPAWLRIPLDHCLVSRELSVIGCRLGPDVGSDHLPLVVDLAVPARRLAAR